MAPHSDTLRNLSPRGGKIPNEVVPLILVFTYIPDMALSNKYLELIIDCLELK